MQSYRSESFLVLPLFPIFLMGAFPVLLLSFIGFAGIAILGALMMATALIVAFEADTELKTQNSAISVARRGERNAPSSTRDSMVRFATVTGALGAASVVFSVVGFFAQG